MSSFHESSPRLSLAMIVKNEGANLAHCLDSVASLVDEMVVVDTGSTDDTVEIALGRGAKVHDFTWCDDFAAARNASLEYCTGDWVLILDGDEAIDRLDHDLIRRTVSKGSAAAYRLVLRNYFSGGGTTVQGGAVQINRSKYSEGSTHSHYADGKAIRLCKRLPGLRFEGRIHEILEPFFKAQRQPIQDLQAVIHHYGKLDRGKENVKKHYYLGLAFQDAQEHPEDFQKQFNVLQQAMAVEAWEQVHTSAQACLRLENMDIVHPLVLLGVGMALQFHGQHDESLRHLDKLLARFPRHAQGHTRRAFSLAGTGRLDEARESLRSAIRAEPGFIVPYVNLAELESQNGHYLPAREAILLGLKANPKDPQLWHALVQLGVETGDLERATEDAKLAIQRCPQGGQGVWHRLVAFACLKRGDRAEALRILQLGLEVFPGDPDLIRMRALAG